MEMEIRWEKMEWETSFFGYPVARIYPPFQQNGLNKLLSDLRREGYVFVYAFCSPPSVEQLAMKLAGARNAATRVVFQRTLLGLSGLIPVNVDEYPVNGQSEILQTLAIQSGVYSRYRRDQHFPTGSFEAMYSIWMEKSVRHELADVVFVIREQEMIAGIVTIKKEENIAKIGLFAVLNIFRRKGMGRQLMEAAYAWALHNNCTELQVVGQIENRDACRFYERMGLEMTEIQQAMHLWM